MYTVTNNSYDPFCPLFFSNGFSGFILYLDPGLIDEIANIESPTPDWLIGAQYSLPINWDIISDDGIMPGNSASFSYTTDPREPVNSEGYFNTRCFGIPVHPVNFTVSDGPEGPGARVVLLR
jgi:hypothetical protein